jgi:3-oxoacyl-[acyl-carrier protein] reductase
MPIDGAVCVVTGATEGIGRAIAFALARRGGRLAVCARTGVKVEQLVAKLKKAGVDAAGGACDVSDENDVRTYTDFVRRELGPVDVLVNNAGLGYMRDVAEMGTAEFDETMAVNVRGVFLMTRAVLPDMMRRGSGHIVNVASLAGRNPVPGGAAYAASKHAVLGFSKSLMLEVRKHGIRVMAVCPGSVVTPFFDKSGMGLQHPDRKLQPEDVADVVVAALELPDRANASEIDIRPSNP